MSLLPSERFEGLWTALGAHGDGRAVFLELRASYDEPHRAYHTAKHIGACLRLLDDPEVSALAEHRAEVEAAIWFHDAIYDTHARDNEERSARLLEERLTSAGVAIEVVGRIAEYVRATKDHITDSVDGQLAIDIDLSILGEVPEVFTRFEEEIRREYSWVDDAAYVAAVPRCFDTSPIARSSTARDSSAVATRRSRERTSQRRFVGSLSELTHSPEAGRCVALALDSAIIEAPPAIIPPPRRSGTSETTIRASPRAGPEPHTATSIAQTQASPRAVAADATSVYWALGGTGIIMGADPDGKNAKSVNAASAAAGANSVTVDGSGAYWGNKHGRHGLARRQGRRQREAASSLGDCGRRRHGPRRCDRDERRVRLLHRSRRWSGDARADGRQRPAVHRRDRLRERSRRCGGRRDGHLLGAANSGSVFTVAASGPPAVAAAIAMNQGNPFSVALDGTTAYWSNASAVGGAASSGTIMKKTAAGVPTPLAGGQPIPTCIAVDGTSVYWMNAFGASIMRVAK